MKIKVVLLFSLFVCFTFGQKTKWKTKKYKNPYYIERYQVLRSDKSVKHGNYQKLDLDEEVKVNGYYHQGLKDSLWTTYYRVFNTVKKAGHYKDGQRVGEWNFYASNGDLLQTYDYSLKKLVYSAKPYNTSVMKGDSIYETTLLQNPQYIGATVELYDYILPLQMDLAKDSNLQMKSGRVSISFFVDTNGIAFNHQIETSISEEIDAACMAIAKSIPQNWIPGRNVKGPVVAMRKVYMIFNYSVR